MQNTWPAAARRRLPLLLIVTLLLAMAALLVPAQRAFADDGDGETALLTDAYRNQDAASEVVYVLQGDKDFSTAIDLSALGWVDEVLSVTTDNANATIESSYFLDWTGDLHVRIAGNAVGASTVTYEVLLGDGTVSTGSFRVKVFDIDLGNRSFTGTNYVLYKGRTATPRVTGLPKGRWTTSDPAVAKVSSKGAISYKGLGACEVRGAFGPIEVVIPVDCTYKKAYLAVKNGSPM